MIEGLDALLGRFGIVPKDISLYEMAFTHASYTNEHPNSPSYDRLEFLGDAVLDLVIASYAYKNYPTLNSGQLSKVRALLVEGKTLTDFSENRFGFASLVRYSVGEKGNTRFHKHINEDSMSPSFPTSSRNWTIPIRRAVSKKSSSAISTMSASTRRTSTPRMSATSSRRG